MEREKVGRCVSSGLGGFLLDDLGSIACRDPIYG